MNKIILKKMISLLEGVESWCSESKKRLASKAERKIKIQPSTEESVDYSEVRILSGEELYEALNANCEIILPED